MNDVIHTIKNHCSIRNYTDDPVKEEDLKLILEAAIQAPSSMNGQQRSIIIVKDQEKKEKIAQLAGDQQWIANAPVFLVFVMDYSRIAKKMKAIGVPFENIHSVEAIMAGCVDAALALGNAMNTAESLGYGIVPIGGIRSEPYELIEMLELPEYVYPLLGLCIGVPDREQGLKPRLPYKAIVSVDTYNAQTEELVDEYDEVIREYLLERNDGKSTSTWSAQVSSAYKQVYFPKVYDSLKQQGFSNNC